eukprot:2034299-Rhodomonas_salina.1
MLHQFRTCNSSNLLLSNASSISNVQQQQHSTFQRFVNASFPTLRQRATTATRQPSSTLSHQTQFGALFRRGSKGFGGKGMPCGGGGFAGGGP